MIRDSIKLLFNFIASNAIFTYILSLNDAPIQCFGYLEALFGWLNLDDLVPDNYIV